MTNSTETLPDVLCPCTVIVNVQIIKDVTLIARVNEKSSNVDEAFYNLLTTWTISETIMLQGGVKKRVTASQQSMKFSSKIAQHLMKLQTSRPVSLGVLSRTLRVCNLAKY